MSITFGALSTGSHLHGSINAGPWEYAKSVQSFFGVTGEIHLNGGLRGRELTCWLLLSGYSTHALLHAGILTLQGYTSQAGSVVWTVGADTITYANCVFEGFTPEEPPWLDGSGVNGWTVLGNLKFRQIAP